MILHIYFFFFQAEDGIRDLTVTGVQTCALPIWLRQFIAIGRAHIEFEETDVWPWVRLALSEQELDDLGAQLEQGKRLAPTRAHPNLPCTPEVLKVAAPIAGAADRIRDALAGRNRD